MFHHSLSFQHCSESSLPIQKTFLVYSCTFCVSAPSHGKSIRHQNFLVNTDDRLLSCEPETYIGPSVFTSFCAITAMLNHHTGIVILCRLHWRTVLTRRNSVYSSNKDLRIHPNFFVNIYSSGVGFVDGWCRGIFCVCSISSLLKVTNRTKNIVFWKAVSFFLNSKYVQLFECWAAGPFWFAVYMQVLVSHYVCSASRKYVPTHKHTKSWQQESIRFQNFLLASNRRFITSRVFNQSFLLTDRILSNKEQKWIDAWLYICQAEARPVWPSHLNDKQAHRSKQGTGLLGAWFEVQWQDIWSSLPLVPPLDMKVQCSERLCLKDRDTKACFLWSMRMNAFGPDKRWCFLHCGGLCFTKGLFAHFGLEVSELTFLAKKVSVSLD